MSISIIRGVLDSANEEAACEAIANRPHTSEPKSTYLNLRIHQGILIRVELPALEHGVVLEHAVLPNLSLATFVRRVDAQPRR